MSEKKTIEPRTGYGVVQTFDDGWEVFYEHFFSGKRDAVKWCLSPQRWGMERLNWRQLKRKYNLRIVRVRLEIIDE